jgi:hypothetical protein
MSYTLLWQTVEIPRIEKKDKEKKEIRPNAYRRVTVLFTSQAGSFMNLPTEMLSLIGATELPFIFSRTRKFFKV